MTDWSPSRSQQAAQWWAQFLLKYLVGAGGLVYEVGVDRLHQPTALVIFGGIAGITDVLNYRSIVRAQARAEAEAETATRKDPGSR